MACGGGPAAGGGTPPLRRGRPFLEAPISGERMEKGLNGSVDGEKADGGFEGRPRAVFAPFWE